MIVMIAAPQVYKARLLRQEEPQPVGPGRLFLLAGNEDRAPRL
jgi:hypothetical protein